MYARAHAHARPHAHARARAPRRPDPVTEPADGAPPWHLRLPRDPNLARLAGIMHALRAPDGCPWDREQSLETLRHYLLEESHEVLEVMTGEDAALHCEELGDLLLQIAFQAQLRSETGAFDLADVVASICDKLESRHPHVFGDERAADAAAVSRRWDEIKHREGKPRGPAGVSQHLPALMRAEKIGEKAAKLGFDWPDPEGPLAKVSEELRELEAARAIEDPALRSRRLHEELGDLLFSVVNVARHLGVRPELALHDASARFLTRFAAVSAQVPDTRTATLDELDRAWEAAKRDERT